jgi:hypothetical protein
MTENNGHNANDVGPPNGPRLSRRTTGTPDLPPGLDGPGWTPGDIVEPPRPPEHAYPIDIETDNLPDFVAVMLPGGSTGYTTLLLDRDELQCLISQLIVADELFDEYDDVCANCRAKS